MPYHLSLTDTAGQEEYRGLFATSNLSSDAFLLVYDITSASSLATLSHFTTMIAMEEEAREERGYRGEGGYDGRGHGVKAVKVVVGNKVDLRGMREVSAREGLEWARGRGCGFMETSAREMVNIEETFARRYSVLGLFPFSSSSSSSSASHPFRSSPIDSFLSFVSCPLRLTIGAVIVRRVVEARRLAAEGGARDQRGQLAHSTARTRPLAPVDEKRDGLGSVDLADRPGGKTKRGGVWARLRCW